MEQIHVCKQWSIEADKTSGEYRIVNLAADGTRQFYQVYSGQYGQPLLEPEPDRAFPVPSGVTYVNARGETLVPSEKIAGIICRDANGTIVLRLSLTNAANKGIAFQQNSDGSLQVDGKTFHLKALVSKDKNRVRNYDAFYSPEQSDTVKVLELEDLIF